MAVPGYVWVRSHAHPLAVPEYAHYVCLTCGIIYE